MGSSLKLLYISGARTKHEAPWERKFGWLYIQEILFLRKSYIHPPFHVSWGEISHFKHPHISAVNHMSTLGF